MSRFFEVTFKPFFVVMGAGTAVAALAAIAPRFTVELLAKTPFLPEYGIVVRHWGVMVGLAGIFMIIAAFAERWRKPVLAYSAVEKALFVWVWAANAHEPYAASFALPAAMDSLVVLYVLAYFWAGAGSAQN